MTKPIAKVGREAMHFKRRARERLGEHLNRHDLKAIVEAIQTGKAQFVSRQSIRVTRWKMLVRSRMCLVVYDRKRKQVVTLWPVEIADAREAVAP